MKIYNSRDISENPILKFIGKDVWVEGCDDQGYYYYFRFLSYDDLYITCNIINADIIDYLDASYLLDEFPRYPAEPMDLNRFFLEKFEYLLSDIEVYEPLSILTSEEIRDMLQQCLQKIEGEV